MTGLDYRILRNGSGVWHLCSLTSGLRAYCGFRADPAKVTITDLGHVTCRGCLRTTEFQMAQATGAVWEQL